MTPGGSPEPPEGPPPGPGEVVPEASPPLAQTPEGPDPTTTAALNRGQKRSRSPQPGTSLLTMYFPVTSKKVSTVLEGATRPGARVVAGTAAAAASAAAQRQALARLEAAPTSPLSGVRVIEALEYLLAQGPLASRDCFVNTGQRTHWELWHVRTMVELHTFNNPLWMNNMPDARGKVKLGAHGRCLVGDVLIVSCMHACIVIYQFLLMLLM
mmetsp:Transcript_28163/g.83410  ORF Transcript_28163/g.83410 Transcript_28163/m.83410 type:complete len:212 (-) Transcript_28163:211-846(-)